MSASLGFPFPEGWLCAKMTDDALAFNAVWNITFGSTTVPDTPPIEISW